MLARIAAGLLLASAFVHAAEIHGKVVNVLGGEPLARVQVVVLETGSEAIRSALLRKSSRFSPGKP